MDATSQISTALSGRYVVERELGTGGMATVFLVHDLKHDRKVALKALRPDVALSIGAERFLKEIHLAAKLSHPHILPLYDSGDVEGLLFFVMPNAEGASLRDRLDAAGQLPIEEAVRIAQEVAGALDYAHRHGVVHRDIKPENIMLHDGHALVADFGIGKALGDAEAAAITRTGAMVGTPTYMSPEQAACESVDGRSDIYSLGCVLYELLAGEPPFTGSTVQAVIAKRFVQTPADITVLRDGVSRSVARALQKALARTPIDRFDTAGQFAAALAERDEPPHQSQRHPAPDKSIAVLPFANMSADPENEFFANGVAEEIVNALSQIGELRVAGHTSSFSFKGKNQNLREIGEQLNVRTVLEGSVRRAGKRVRITAQLIDVTDGYHLWSERYDREIEDVFAVQDEIASAIAGKLKTTLRTGDAARSQRAADNIDAYEAYLKGRALFYRRGAAMRQGLAMMERALSLDPEYGLAWAGLADTYSMLGYYGQLTPEEARFKATDAAARAIRFAPDLAETHTAVAQVKLLYDWDWEGSGRHFRRALDLNPGYVQGAVWYYFFYLGFVRGEWDHAMRGLLDIQARDRLSAYASSVVAMGYEANSSDPVALAWAEKANMLDPDAFVAQWCRQLAYHAIGDWKNTEGAAAVALASSGRLSLPLTILGLSRVEAGDQIGARAIYDEMRSRAVREYIPPTCLAMIAAALAENDVAIAYAREAMRRHDPTLAVFASASSWGKQLRALTEVQELFAEMRLPAALK